MTVLEAIDGARLSEITATETSLRRFLYGLPGVDQVGAEFRAATLATRSIKTTAKQTAIDLAISMIDLTTLEGQDTPGKVKSLCAKALRPDPSDPTVPPVAAVCVYPDLVETAKQALRTSGVKVASVATAFPSGRASLEVRVQDTRDAVAAGADEIDMVDRGAFLSGRYGEVFDEIVAVKEACAGGAGQQSAHLKVILETGSSRRTTTSAERRGWRCLRAAISSRPAPARSRPQQPCRSRWSCWRRCGTSGTRRVGRSASNRPGHPYHQGRHPLLGSVNETVGDDWLEPEWFRIGASSLLNDLLMQRQKSTTGRYSGPDYFTLD